VIFTWVSEAGRSHRLEIIHEQPGNSPVVSVVDVEGWRVEVRLALQRGRVIASGLQIASVTDELPSAGLTARILSRVPVHAHQRAFADLLRRPGARRLAIPLRVPAGSTARLHGTLADLFAGTSLGALPSSPPPARRRGRRPIATETLLEVANTYDAAVANGSPQPTQDVVTKYPDMTLARARDLVHRARQRGLLTPATWGRPGGALTPNARALLKRRPRQTTTSSRRKPR